jgi:hypothetical protein
MCARITPDILALNVIRYISGACFVGNDEDNEMLHRLADFMRSRAEDYPLICHLWLAGYLFVMHDSPDEVVNGGMRGRAARRRSAHPHVVVNERAYIARGMEANMYAGMGALASLLANGY